MMMILVSFLSVLLVIAEVLVCFAATDVAGDDGDDWRSNNQC